MARITVEDCLERVNNRFTLIHMSAKRVRQLRKGATPTIQSKNKDVVISLREIAAGNVWILEEGEGNEALNDSAPLLPNGTKEEATPLENKTDTEQKDEAPGGE